eukprot:1301080-Prorocentrum_lima.AAC.1
MLGANLITIEYVPSQENAAAALAKGLTTAVHLWEVDLKYSSRSTCLHHIVCSARPVTVTQ